MNEQHSNPPAQATPPLLHRLQRKQLPWIQSCEQQSPLPAQASPQPLHAELEPESELEPPPLPADPAAPPVGPPSGNEVLPPPPPAADPAAPPMPEEAPAFGPPSEGTPDGETSLELHAMSSA